MFGCWGWVRISERRKLILEGVGFKCCKGCEKKIVKYLLWESRVCGFNPGTWLVQWAELSPALCFVYPRQYHSVAQNLQPEWVLNLWSSFLSLPSSFFFFVSLNLWLNLNFPAFSRILVNMYIPNLKFAELFMSVQTEIEPHLAGETHHHKVAFSRARLTHCPLVSPSAGNWCRICSGGDCIHSCSLL